jgi:hypothetical protein
LPIAIPFTKRRHHRRLALPRPVLAEAGLREKLADRVDRPDVVLVAVWSDLAQFGCAPQQQPLSGAGANALLGQLRNPAFNHAV